MSRFAFSALRFTTRVLTQTSIQSSLDDLETHLNSPSLDKTDVSPQAINYRHLVQPVRYSYFSADGNNLVNTYTIDPTSHGGWYAATENVIKHTSTLASTRNLVGTVQRPVVLALARVYFSSVNGAFWGDGGNLITKMAIGYSTDNMATWSHVPESIRYFGPTRGGAREFYNESDQPHPWWPPPATYSPFNAMRDPPVSTQAGFGGKFSVADPSTITHYTIMFDHTDTGACRPWVELEVLARDEE